MNTTKLSDYRCTIPRWISHPWDHEVIFQDKPIDEDLQRHAYLAMDLGRDHQGVVHNLNVAVWFLKNIFESSEEKTSNQIRSIAKEAIRIIRAENWTLDKNGYLVKPLTKREVI